MNRILIFSYLAQAYISFIGVILMPLYLHFMGAEAFGLVGIFLMLQAWILLLDFGLTPTLSREMSLYRSGKHDALAAWRRLRSLEWVFATLSLISLFTFWLSKGWIANSWLKVENIDADIVVVSIFLMGVAATLRWLTGFYRAALIGLERHAWVNGTQALFATVKFLLVIPVLALTTSPALVFFLYQAIACLLELIVFARGLYRSLPGAPDSALPDLVALKAMWPTASAMAFMAGIWIFISQIDKLILSQILSLESFGYFTLAVAVAGGGLLLLPSLNQVLQPRMTILAAQGQTEELSRLYHSATQFAVVVFGVLGGGLALLAEPVLWAWTGNREVSANVAPILFWYGLANALITLLFFPFMLQFAYGYLRLHVLGNIILALTLLPALIAAAMYFGATGTGMVLFFANLIFLLFWVPLVHKRLLPQAVWRWPLRDIIPIAATTLVVLWGASLIIPADTSRFMSLFFVIVAMIFSASAGIFIGESTREWAKAILSRGKGS